MGDLSTEIAAKTLRQTALPENFFLPEELRGEKKTEKYVPFMSPRWQMIIIREMMKGSSTM